MLQSHVDQIAHAQSHDEAPRFVECLDGLFEGRVTGVDLRLLPAGTTLIIETRHSSYHVTALGDTDIMIQGGAFFPDQTRARIEGSTAGGHGIRIGCIDPGLRLEIRVGRRRVVTSPVLSIRVDG